MKTARLVLCLFLIPQLLFGPYLQAETLPYQLVDRDKYDLFEDERKAQAEQELIIEDAPDDAQLLKYTNEFWRQAVTAVEGDYSLDKEPEPIPDLTLLNPTLSLPLYGTNVALTGRYVIGFKLDAKRYTQDANNNIEDRNVRNFEMQQEMQLKMQGKILDRIFVDIDYDDKREEEKTLSVAYRGKPGELVQSAEFGDINLSLPQTEFIAYEKQLFGAKVHLQHKNLDLNIIGSQTKGSSKQKQFVGSSVFEIVTLKDTDYVRRTYYDLTFGTNIAGLPGNSWSLDMGSIATASEEVYVDTNTTTGDYVPVSLQARDYATGQVVHSGTFKLLQRGVDYTVDYTRGIIQFTSAQTAASVIAVNYQNSAGKWLSDNQNQPYVIKTANEKYIYSSAEIGYQLEMKTFYNIGAQQITRDNGKGNFLLNLLDANGQEVGYNANPQQVYPNTIDVDFDKGVFELQSRMTDDLGLYNATPVSSKNRTFQVEYTSTVKTYFVEAGIVVESESVRLNGAQLQRNNDYYIDYTSGYLTIYDGERITENSVIDITYDTTGGSSSNNSLIGGRLDYKLFDKIKLGATALKEGWDQPDTVPQVGNYAQDLLVYGADINAKDLNVTDNLSVDFGAEVAHSVKNENAFGYAMVDSMNEATIQTAGSNIFYDWTIASNPNGKPAFIDSVAWDTQELPMLEINPNAVGTYNEKQQVLVINYDFTDIMTKRALDGSSLQDHDEISIVYPLSTSGVDLSDKTSFELTMLGEGSTTAAPQIDITFGNISEYSDSINPAVGPENLVANGYGMLTSCSPTTTEEGGTLIGAPKTEDVNCLTTLAPNEDQGWWFTNPDGTVVRFNPFVNNQFNPERQPNGRIDSQDLNKNGKYDAEDYTVGGHFGYGGMAIEGLTNSSLAYNGWQTFTSPLNIADSAKGNWTAVRHLRITLKLTDEMKAQGRYKGTVKIANVSLSGTAWNPQEGIEPEQLSVSGINNVDNTNYVPIFASNNGDGTEVFKYLYGSVAEYKEQNDTANVMDQALNLTFDTRQVYDDSLYANRNFSSMDFTQHKEFRFLVYSKPQNAGSEFFLRVGTDENYDKVIVPLDFGTAQWRLISLKMVDSDGDGIADTLQNASKEEYNVRVVNRRVSGGIMNFKQVSMIVAGVEKETDPDNPDAYIGTGSAGEVWLNVIHLAESVTTEGTAYKVDGAVRLDGWGSAGAKYKHMDGTFQTPLTVAKEQEVTEEEYFLNVDKFKNFPMQATLNRSTTVTPNVTDTEDYNTVSSLDKGTVERQRANVRGDFIKENLPQIGLQYTLEEVDYNMLQRKDKAQTYAVTMTHNSQGAVKSLNAGYSYTDTTIDYAKETHLTSSSNYNTQEETQRMNFKMNYEPTSNFNITPNYSLTQSKEERTKFKTLESADTNRYPKGMNQNVGFNSTWRIAKWLAPSVSYSISTTETNNLTEKIFNQGKADEEAYDIGELKSVNRNADGGVSLTLNGNEILPKSKLFKSFVISSSYRLQDADSWSYVDEGFDSRADLWIRSSLSGTGKHSNLQSLILRDTFTSSQRWSPLAEYNLNGALSPLKTISILNNFTHSIQQNNQTGTEYESKSLTLPDLVFSISDVEKFFYGGRWISSTNIKLRYAEVENTTVDSKEQLERKYGGDLRFLLFNMFDTVLVYDKQTSNSDDLRAFQSLEAIDGEDFSAQTSFYLGNWRFTPKVVYSNYEKRLVRGQLSESHKEVTPSLNVRLDFNLPRGIKLPFINRMYNATNRVIWNTTIAYTTRESPVEVKDNYNLLDITSSLDYEISQNLRLNLAGSVQWLKHAYVETEDYMAYNLGANITIQF